MLHQKFTPMSCPPTSDITVDLAEMCAYVINAANLAWPYLFCQHDSVSFFSPHLRLCPHLNPKLLIKVSWAEENAAAVHTEWLKKKRSHLWKRPLETKYPEWTARMAKHKQADRFCSPPSSLVTLLSLGLSNGGSLSRVTMTIRPS